MSAVTEITTHTTLLNLHTHILRDIRNQIPPETDPTAEADDVYSMSGVGVKNTKLSSGLPFRLEGTWTAGSRGWGVADLPKDSFALTLHRRELGIDDNLAVFWTNRTSRLRQIHAQLAMVHTGHNFTVISLAVENNNNVWGSPKVEEHVRKACVRHIIPSQ